MAIFYASHYTNMTITNSTFLDNYSTGRGSVIFTENMYSLVSISNSTFSRNYAFLGGVFFTQLNGIV